MVEVRNVHGERPVKELSITEFIHSMRNAPRFAHQEGMTHRPYTYTFDQRFPQNASACTAKTCIAPQSGKIGSRPPGFYLT